MQSLFQEIERSKRLGQSVRAPVLNGFTKACSTCGREPVTSEIASKGWRLGDACKKRFDQRVASTKQQREKYFSFANNDDRLNDLTFSWDFNELAGGDYLGTIVLDGDEIGERLQNMFSQEAHSNFCKRFNHLVRDCLQASLKHILSLIHISEPTRPY